MAAPCTPAQRSINTLELNGIDAMRVGNLAAAEVDLAEALTQRVAQHPDDPEHEALAPAINNLAAVHLKQNRLSEAAEGFRRVVTIKERLLQQQGGAPSSRTILEIESAKRNLVTAERFGGCELVRMEPAASEPQRRER